VTKSRAAGDLRHRVAFDLRSTIENADGNTLGDWEEQFRTAAGYIHLRGGEAVLAARLQGQHSQVIFTRAFSATREVTAEYRIRDARTGIAYNIRDIVETENRKWMEFTVQSGGADG
jgi:head-tail adaptor